MQKTNTDKKRTEQLKQTNDKVHIKVG